MKKKMKVTNIHKRTFNQPKESISDILDSLSSNNDQLWPYEKWPPIVFKKGLCDGAIGGHGPIKYLIKQYVPGNLIEFKFRKPNGFNGIHKFEISEIEKNKTELKHTIDMTISGKGILTWYIAIKWIHDALLEDCLDKVENSINTKKIKTDWSRWVVYLRKKLSA